MSDRFTLHHGDSREKLSDVADGSVDSIVCDPPYHLTTGKKGGTGPASVSLDSPYGRARVTTGFMGMTWDGGDVAHDPAFWAECLRVAKPGAWLAAFGGTRTYHRLACAIEDAGWELRDSPIRGHMHQPEDCPWLHGWMYGSGFPKSHNGEWGGTALKPAWEPIVLARKPLIGTVEANWREHGTGALNIDECRIGWPDGVPPEIGTPAWGGPAKKSTAVPGQDGVTVEREPPSPLGRWPANLMHDGSDEVVALFPNSEGSGSARTLNRSAKREQDGWGMNTLAADSVQLPDAGTGSAARFFYCAKASQEDQNEGCFELPKRGGHIASREGGGGWAKDAAKNPALPRANHHPTVKPTDLMRWLVRLVTPKEGLVLDPFMGSGSTGKAAMLEGRRFIGIDLTAEYVEIARARIEFALRQGHQPDLLEA